jgi:uncharacterized protein (DUF2252 family)
VQACGDCHLLNFGAFATPERRVIIDINDFDETLPAPWEWDLKRLAASFVLACRDNGFTEADARFTALACVRSYREHMAEYSEMSMLELWYERIDVKKFIPTIKDEQARRRAQRRLDKAHARSVLEHDFPMLASTVGATPTIRDNPPLIYHPPETYAERMKWVEEALVGYRASLPEHTRVLLDRFKVMDIAIKVVGVGSVGTRCGIMLLLAEGTDPLFLQFKEAQRSVLEDYAGESLYPTHGERVVSGYRIMQSASDMFLGWTLSHDGKHVYVRQLKDMKIKPLVELFTPSVMTQYAELCGWTLALAHARSSHPAQISGYLGRGDQMDLALADFSAAYADQTEKDHQAFMKAARDGRVEIVTEGP